MRFLLRYKDEAPHARMILQGFKHRDVLEAKLDTESRPCHDLAASYDGDWDNGCQIGIPAGGLHPPQGRPVWGALADMRRLLKEMIGLLEHQVMQMTKPAFGDVRAQAVE